MVLSVAEIGGLSEHQVASWLFGSFFLNGLLTIVFSLVHRLPLVFFWTIPGTVLIGPALGHLTMPEVVGAYLATGVLMLVLGLSGRVGRMMRLIPMPIVMAMVAGVFLKFGTDLIVALNDTWRLALPMTSVFFLFTALPGIGRRIPPLIAAMLTGALIVAIGGDAPTVTSGALLPDGWIQAIAHPILYQPAFSMAAMIELVVPLAITVLIVQNGQGFAVLEASGHETPLDSVAAACGATSIATAFVGTVSTCLTGPASALVTHSGESRRHYSSAAFTGMLALGFGLLAPLFTRVMLGLPGAFIATLAGLAMLRVLQHAFATAFGGRFGFGALVSFLVTVAGLPLAGVGAPFWGIVFGVAASALIERKDFAAG